MSKPLTIHVQEVEASGKIVKHVRLVDSDGYTCGVYDTVAQAEKMAPKILWNLQRGRVNLKTINRPKFGSSNPALYNNTRNNSSKRKYN